MPAIAASSEYENSRPRTAARCATSFALPSRSSRASSESCKVTGIAAAAAPRFHHGLSEFLGEQRDAVGSRHELLHHRLGESARDTHRRDHLPRLPLGQPPERHRLQI